MIILDTNVISALMQKSPAKSVVRWLDRQPRTAIWITSITAYEIGFALRILRTGTRPAVMEGFEELLNRLDERIAPFDTEAAEQAAIVTAVRHKKGYPNDLRDTMVAGIVRAQRATLATRNVERFEGLGASLVNPWVG
jgi:toxin FitB